MSRWTYNEGKAEGKVETAGTASVKTTDFEKAVETCDGLDCYLRLYRGTEFGAGSLPRLTC